MTKRSPAHAHAAGKSFGRELTARHSEPEVKLTANHKKITQAIHGYDVVFVVGPAGAGKTYTSVETAYSMLSKKQISKIILTRPAIEAGETLGFLPGTLREKVAPYLRPLYDAFTEIAGAQSMEARLKDGTIEIAPIAYMRGRTLNEAFIIADEVQNLTYGQLKMLLTRLGRNSKMVLTGDPTQNDLHDGLSGLEDMIKKLKPLEKEIGFVELSADDNLRHPVVAKILRTLSHDLPAQPSLPQNEKLAPKRPAAPAAYSNGYANGHDRSPGG